ncbi:MAG: type VII secretion protein EssB/YukC [Breznakia sp.]
MDRILKEEDIIVVSEDRTRYKNTDIKILEKWYPTEYKTLKLMEITDEDGYINYRFYAKNIKTFQVHKLTILEKLRCAYGMFGYEALFKKGYQVSFDDENMYLDTSNSIEILFVVDTKLYKDDTHEHDFFKQMKARILSMFSKYSFEEIMKSNFTLSFTSNFENEILDKENVEELKDVLHRYIKKEEIEQEKNYVFVKKRGFILYRVFMYMFLLLFLCVGTYSIYNYISNVQHLEFGNQLYGEFVDGNYAEVLKMSEKKELNNKQKYMAGYAAIVTSSLDEKKQNTILSTYTGSISESVMEYWMYIGYGNYEEAISKGKSVNNDEYVLYALRLEENRLYNDETMEGTKKEKSLKSVQEAIQDYEERLGISKERALDNE